MKSPAFETLSNFRDLCLHLLEFAIRAPSTHNTQPWLFEIGQNSIKVYIDEHKYLKCADPLERDVYISIGCAIENLILASKYYSVFESVSYSPSTDVVAEINLKKYKNLKHRLNLSLMLEEIHEWRNSRGIFLKNNISINNILNNSPVNLHEFSQDEIVFEIIYDRYLIKQIANLTEKAVKIAHRDKLFRHEISKWLNNSYSKKEEGMPGYALGMSPAMSFIIPTLIHWINLGSILAKKSSQSLKSAMAVLVISSKYENPITWLKVGRLAQRLMLLLHVSNLKTSIYVGAIEVESVNRELYSCLSVSNLKPQFLFATGKMKGLFRQSPRIRVKDKLK